MNFQTLFNNTTTNRDNLKPAFNVGEIPTQQHFYDLIEGLFLHGNTMYKAENSGLAIQAGTDTDKTALLLYTDATSEPAWQLGVANGFELKDSAGNTQWMVTNDGKVGIGTTSPGDVLSLGANQLNFAPYADIGTFTEAAIIKALGDLVIDFDNNTNDTSGVFAITHDNGASEVFRINQEGKVGIGTTSPTTRLDITQEAPGIALNVETTTYAGVSGYTGISLKAKDENDIVNEWVLYNSISNSTESYNGIGFFDPAVSSYRLFINKSDGNVGIGTTNPAASLDILAPAVGGNEDILKMKVTDAPSDYLKFGNITAAAGQFMPSIMAHHDTDNREALFVIGSISPSSNNGTNAIMYFEARTEGAPYTVPESSTRPLFAWGSYNAKKMVMMANGNVGIGTTSPQHRLDIDSNTNEILRLDGLYASGNAPATKVSFGGAGTRYGAVWWVPGLNEFQFTQSTNNWFGGAGYYASIRGNAIYSNSTQLTSDIRFKKDIMPITHEVIAKLGQLQGNTYQWRTEEFKNRDFAEGTQLGFIAQEMQEVYPELVNEDHQGDLSINYTGLIPVLTEALKDLNNKSEEAAKDLNNKNEALEARVMHLEKLVLKANMEA
ncbi:tail fiber domain-containing protein [Microscilla marina]|nr:tail fiber domain-containing protein [Microscilla marina]